MKLTNNTILITGGSAGIGLALAERLSGGNKVIITGRDEQGLKAAAARLGNVATIAGDVSDAADVDRLVQVLVRDYPQLNIVINNAGRAYAYNPAAAGAEAYEKAAAEMLTNYLSVVRLNERLLPLLQRQAEAAIVNVSSTVALVPAAGIPTYSASKAALRSYTLTLRHLLADGPVKVFELMPPLVNTRLTADIGGPQRGIAPSVVADALVAGLEKDEYEIRVGRTEEVYRLMLASPADAFRAVNPPAVNSPAVNPPAVNPEPVNSNPQPA